MITQIDIGELTIKRLSDAAVEEAVRNNKSKFSEELVNIDKSDLDKVRGLHFSIKKQK